MLRLRSYLLDVYFIYRLLKRATKRKPDRSKLALKGGEPITHVIGYAGAIHITQTRDMLLKLGFRVIDQSVEYNTVNGSIFKYLPFSSLKKTMDRFIE